MVASAAILINKVDFEYCVPNTVLYFVLYQVLGIKYLMPKYLRRTTKTSINVSGCFFVRNT
mgnify:FL=1